jgi:hypothetical protein
MSLLRLVLLMLISTVAAAQSSTSDFLDLLGLARLKDYTAARVSSDSQYVFSNDDFKGITPGETLVMAGLEGPGMVTHIWVTVADNEYAWPRLLRLRVYYDGEKTPSVDTPLGDFFGVGHGYERNLDSMMVRDSSFGRARNSYWPMPYRKACKITVTNEGNRYVSLYYYHVDYRKYGSLPPDLGYFHAYYRQERPAVAGRNYAFLNIRGRGHYVGTVLNIIQAQVSWFGEGDDLFYVDGSTHPQIYGTGSEDYFNDAWDLRVSNGAWTGTPVAEGEQVGSRLTGYRWHIPDPIPFSQSLWAGIEHYGWTSNPDGSVRSGFEERPDYFSSAAFWYQDGVNQELAEPPYGNERLPLGNARQVVIEDTIKDVTAEKGKAEVQRGVDWDKDLLFLEAEGTGARINVPLDVAESGRYEIVARTAEAPDYGNYVALVDGQDTNLDKRKPATSEIPFPGVHVIQSYLPEVYVSVDRPLGWFRLDKGRHSVSFVCVGRDERSAGYNFGVEDLILERLPISAGEFEPEVKHQFEPKLPAAVPIEPPGTPVYRGHPLADYEAKLRQAAAPGRPELLRAIGSFGADGAPVAGLVAGMLADPDEQVRAAAAWSLSQIGAPAAKSAPAAVGALAKVLSDPNPKVRSLAAVALEAMGPAATAALPQLVRTLNDPADYVRAKAADALGAMGPEARPAVRPLADRLLVKDEQGMVLGSVAAALGDIGPDARDALPILERTRKSLQVGYTIEAAILKIQGKPVPSWW